MRAVVQHGLEPDQVSLTTLDDPAPGEDDVIIEVLAAGVCGSDLHQWHGHPSWVVEPPVVLGHEFCGRVVAAGDRVAGFQPGDRVVSETAAHVDMHSPLARVGSYNIDPERRGFGTRVNGGMAERARVPARCLHHLPDGVPTAIGGIVEPVAVAYNAVVARSAIKPGDIVVVLGPGPIGLLCCWLAHLAGAGEIVVAGLPSDESRMGHARALGATFTHTGDPEALTDIARDLSDGLGAHTVIDAAGVSASFITAMDAVRPGGSITKVGWGPQPLNASLDPIVAKAITVNGCFSHTWPTWEAVVGLVGRRFDEIMPMIGWKGPLEHWIDGFEAMESGTAVKSVLLPSGVAEADSTS